MDAKLKKLERSLKDIELRNKVLEKKFLGRNRERSSSLDNPRKRKPSSDEENPGKRSDLRQSPVKSRMADQDHLHGGVDNAGGGPLIENDGDLLAALGDNPEDLTDDEIARIQDELDQEAPTGAATNGVPVNYAAAAKKPKKRTYPWAVYIRSETGGKISRKHFEAFHEKIIEDCLELDQVELDKVNIDFVTFRFGSGLIACADHYTANWCKEKAVTFSFEGLMTKGYSRWETSNAWVFKGFLHGEAWKNRKVKGPFVISKGLKQNGIPGTFSNLIWDTKSQMGVYFSFECKGEMEEALIAKGLRVKIGGQRVLLKKRLRVQRSMREWLRYHGYLRNQAANGEAGENGEAAANGV